jgi:hypothetical protein
VGNGFVAHPVARQLSTSGSPARRRDFPDVHEVFAQKFLKEFMAMAFLKNQ